LTVAPPAAFGFLGSDPASITIQGSSLQVPPGQALSVVGGNMTIMGGPATSRDTPTLAAPSGRIQIASVASPGDVRFSRLELAPDLQVDAFARLGRLTLSQGALVEASGNGGGTVLFRSGQLLVDRSNVFADNRGHVDNVGLGLDLGIRADAVIRNGSFLTTDSFGAGRAGDLQLTADSVHVDGSMDFAVIGSRAFLASGAGGNVAVQAGRVTLTGGGSISTGTFGILDTGHSGDMTVMATEAIAISGRGTNTSGLYSTTSGRADAGGISVSTPLLTMEEGRIRASTFGDGNAGNIDVRGGRVTLTGGAFIDSGTRPRSRGNAGSLEVQVGQLTLTGGGQISTNTQGSGRGGELRVAATDTIAISGPNAEGSPSGLFSSTQGSGEAGRLSLSTPLLTLTGGGQIVSGTLGAGRGGELTVAADAITISGRTGQGFRSGLFSATRGRGQSGDLRVKARHVQLRDGGTITADSTGDGTAGTIRLQVGETFQSDQGRVITTAAQAGGGSIVLTAGRLVQLRDSELATSVLGGGSDAGNLTVDAPFIISDSSQLRANAVAGMGGRIQINANVFLADPMSQVSASSDLGISGTVAIQAPVTSLGGTLAPLPQAFVSAVALLPARCAARAQGGRYSSLVLGGRGGLPPDPSSVLPSPLVLEERLVADPAGIGVPRPPRSPARFAFLADAEKAWPRLRGDQRAGGCAP